MRCPKCGFEQADGRPDCQACGIIFAKWHPGGPPRPHASQPPPLPAGLPDVYEPRPPTAPAPTPRRGLLAGLALLAVAGLGAWWLNFAPGRSVSESAYRDPDGRFAISPPPGWLTLSAANFEQVFAQFADRLPPAMRQQMRGNQAAVAFFQMGDASEFTPNLNVVVMPRPSSLGGFGEAERQEAVTAVSRELPRILPGYRLDSSRLQKVDGLDAIHILGYATGVFIPGMPSPRGGLRMEQVMVLGPRHAFTLSCTVEAGVVEQAPNCEAMFNSFRVLGSRFGPVVKGGLNGGLIGIALYGLKMLLGS